MCRNLDEQLDDEDEQEVEGAVAPKVPKAKAAGKRKHGEEEEDDVLEKYNLDDYDDEDGNLFQKNSLSQTRGCCGRDCMVVGFTTTCAIRAYHH